MKIMLDGESENDSSEKPIEDDQESISLEAASDDQP